MTAQIFIDGEAGTTGLQIRERLASIAGIDVRSLPSDLRKDSDAKAELMRSVDVVVLCLPDAAAAGTAAQIDAMGNTAPKVIDASSAHRVADRWVYGFPELTEDQPRAIRAARRVSNPGCYATGAIALLRPLVDAGAIDPEFPLTINAVSGYSGGGKSMIGAYEAHEAPSFELYALGLEHKHVPEIVKHAGLRRRPIFVPSVGNFRQGMLVSVPLHLDELPGRPTGADLERIFAGRFRGNGHLRLVPAAEAGGRLEAEALNQTNDLELRVFANESRRQAILVARLDNLGKGASGAAVQNLRLMLDL